MHQYKGELEEAVNGIQFQRLDNKKASRIKLETTLMDYNGFEGKWEDKSNWDDVINWYVQNMMTFYDAVYPIWEKAQRN
jgi:hypothetical protein